MNMKKFIAVIVTCGLLLSVVSAADAATISFTAGDLVRWMVQQGAPLHIFNGVHGDELWGISRVRVIPEVSVPGGYTINLSQGGISPDNFSWRVQTDAIGNPPYGDGVFDTGLHASFNDTHIYSWQGSWFTLGTLHLISDLSQSEFQSRFPAVLTPTSPLPLAKVPDDARFTMDFTLNPGVSWLNQGFYFVVDGYWYNTWYDTDSYDNPIAFTGGFAHNSVQTAGNLQGNMSYGYYGNVPLPGSLLLLGSGLLGLGAWRRLRKG